MYIIPSESKSDIVTTEKKFKQTVNIFESIKDMNI